MKKSIMAMMMFVFAGALFAQKPETVYSIVKDHREISWYQLQQKLWKEEIDKNEKNAEAWYNYYSATRALKNLSWKNPEERNSYYEKCNEIAKDALEAVPESFEANHLNYWNGGIAGKELKYLLKAYELNPNDVRSFNDLMTHYEVEQDLENYSKFCVKYYKLNELAAPLLNWAYNILSEVDENAIILSVGDNDTYPLWVVQEAKNFRKDVKNINTSLIQIDDYRNKVFESLGLPKFEMKMEDVKTQEDMKKFQIGIVDHIFKHYKKGSVYVSVTGIHEFQLDQWSDDFYLTGLSYKYSKESFDNLSLIKRNYEKRYLLDYLTEVFSFNIGNQIADHVDAAYLPSMVKLYKMYDQSEDVAKKNEILKVIISVSQRTGQQTEISELLDHSSNIESAKPNKFMTTLVNTKHLEKKFVKIQANLFAGAMEVTNLEFRSFLNNLKRGRNDELYNKCIYDSAVWKKKFNYTFNQPMVDNYHWHPAYDSYPVVNISKYAADSYCEWLTQQYNTQRKRKYTQVVFRLPTPAEWRLLGVSEGRTSTCFPDDKVTNEKGCYLANFKVAEGDYYSDGGFHTVAVGSYFPNDNGMYCIMGNVAEMTSEEGLAKGGSWYHTFEESHFDKSQSYDGADPGVGFRVVMEVIQE